MSDAIKKILNTSPVMPVLVIEQVEDAVPLARALVAGGLKVLEITLRTEAALAAIQAICQDVEGAIVGAGTVTNIEQIKQVANVGGKLIISPHCDVKLIELCHLLNLHVVTGVATPTEAFTAYQAGAKWLKLFPASTYGINHMKALKSVLPKDVEIIAVGGISEENSQQWLTSGASALGIGNSLYKKGDSLAIINKKMTLFNKMLKHTLI